MIKSGVKCAYIEEIRCKKCHRLLMKGEVRFIEIKCPKCGYIQRIGKGGGSMINVNNK